MAKATKTKASYPMGTPLADFAGWTFYKKKLPDGRIVYNVKIDTDTEPNKTDWEKIKGEIYTQTGFKWGKYGAFEKWGLLASEAYIIKLFSSILEKYYQEKSKGRKEDNEDKLPIKVGEYWVNKKSNRLILFRVYEIDNGIVSSDSKEGLSGIYLSEFITKLQNGEIEKVKYDLKVGDTIFSKQGDKRVIVGFTGNDNDNNKYIQFEWEYNGKKNKSYTEFYVYQSLYEGFWKFTEEEGLSQEKIRDIISGLEVLAEMGDEKAKAMIDGLQVLLID